MGMRMRRHPSFITFEGCDATGKTTQMSLMEDCLRRRGFSVVSTREPGGTPSGEQIRNLLLQSNDGIDPITESLLFAAARVEHVRTIIEPALHAGKIVLCDRYVDSTFAYQGYGSGVDLDWLIALHQTTARGLLPGITVLFVLPRTRELRTLDQSDLIEGRDREFREKVRTGYLELAQRYPERYRTVAVEGEPQQIHLRVRSHVQGLFLEQFRKRRHPHEVGDSDHPG